jgi:metal-responsive CopG/Arc/MetJ family transcriptional regulator
MPNQPRADNPHRMVRVERVLWDAADAAAKQEGTTRSEVMREALRALVARAEAPPTT